MPLGSFRHQGIEPRRVCRRLIWSLVTRPCFSFQSCVEVCLGLCWRDVPDGFQQAAVVEPVDPFEGGVFHGLEAAPWAAAVDDLGLEEAVDRLGQGVVVAVADAADRGFDPGFGQALGVANGQILRSAVRMMDQPRSGLPLMNGLFQGIEHEPGMGRAADPPADDAAGEGVDDEGHVDEALPGRDIGEVADPEHVRRGHAELTVHLVQRAWLGLVRDRRPVFLAADDALNPMSFINRATVQRATSKPSRRIWCQTLRTP
jgi:hypothetical protein